MVKNAIFDPLLENGSQAHFHYGSNDDTLIVQVLGRVLVEGEDWYIVSGHEEKLLEANVIPNGQYTLEYSNLLQPNHMAFIVEPDELSPSFRSLGVIEGGKT